MTGRFGSASSKIYRNTGNGFTEVFAGRLTGVFLGAAAWGHYDNDGDLDIVLSGTTNGLSSCALSKIYKNTGTDFVEVFAGSLRGGNYSSVAWGDYDNDGNLDILMTGATTSSTYYGGKLYRNTGNGFVEVTGIGLATVSDGSIAWGDYNNDGDLDILMTGKDAGGVAVTKLY